MDILFVAGFSPITDKPSESKDFYKGALGLPLKTVMGDYIAVDDFEGTKYFGVWPLSDAAQSCFGTTEWPSEIPVPQATIESRSPSTTSWRRTAHNSRRMAISGAGRCVATNVRAHSCFVVRLSPNSVRNGPQNGQGEVFTDRKSI